MNGFDLLDGMPHLIDLRFADDILFFAQSALEVGKLLGSLVAELSEVCLVLNADKTVILTTQSQPPSTIATDHGISLRVLSGNVAQKWLGCMLSADGLEQKFLDSQYHLQQAAKSYHANKWILEDRKVPISQRLRYFDAIVSSVACFAGTVPFTRHTYKPWTFILGNSADPLLALRRTLTGHSNGMKTCTLGRTSCTFCRRREDSELVPILWCFIWKLAAHIAKRPIHHWMQRILHWQPVGQRRLGRPKHRWESKLEMYCRYQGLVHWEEATQNYKLWEQHLNRFLDFCCQ